jgi:hypothetical protein
MKLRILQFDVPLIGCEFDRGYRLVLGHHPYIAPSNKQHNLNLNQMLDWVCAEYGHDGNTYHGDGNYRLKNPGVWLGVFYPGRVLHPKLAHLAGRKLPDALSLIAPDLALFERLGQQFGFELEIDTSQLLETQIAETVQPFLFKLATAKALRQLAAKLSETLHRNALNVPWYCIKFDLDQRQVIIPVDDRTLVFSL